MALNLFLALWSKIMVKFSDLFLNQKDKESLAHFVIFFFLYREQTTNLMPTSMAEKVLSWTNYEAASSSRWLSKMVIIGLKMRAKINKLLSIPFCFCFN